MKKLEAGDIFLYCEIPLFDSNLSKYNVYENYIVLKISKVHGIKVYYISKIEEERSIGNVYRIRASLLREEGKVKFVK